MHYLEDPPDVNSLLSHRMSNLKSHILHGKASQKNIGLQDAWPTSEEKLDDCQTWSYEDAGIEKQKYSKEECPQQVKGQRS